MKLSIIAALASLASAPAFASTWYYMCVGTITTTNVTLNLNDPNLPGGGSSVQKDNFTFRDLTQRNYILGQIEKYEFLYIGKNLEKSGTPPSVIGTCSNWSRFSKSCSYAVDAKGEALNCTQANLGKLILVR